jgi:hypothetical protein
MVGPHANEIRLLQPRTIRLFLSEFYRVYPDHDRYDWTRLDRELRAVRAFRAAHPEMKFWHLTNFPNWGYKGDVSYHARGPKKQDYGEYDDVHRIVFEKLKVAGLPLKGVTVDNPYDYLIGEHFSVNLKPATTVDWLKRVRAYEDRSRDMSGRRSTSATPPRRSSSPTVPMAARKGRPTTEITCSSQGEAQTRERGMPARNRPVNPGQTEMPPWRSRPDTPCSPDPLAALSRLPPAARDNPDPEQPA